MRPGSFAYGGNRQEALTETPHGKRRIIVAAGIGVTAFIFYRFILDYYYLGDPLFYQRYYDTLFRVDLLTALISQYDYLGSSELIYPIVAWLGANAGIERNILMAAFDGLMYATLFSALKGYRCNAVFIGLSMTNFYLVVLSTSAERLKFSYIFLFIALMAVGRVKAIWIALAPLAHFQTLITQAAILVWHFFASVSSRIKLALIIVAVVGGGALLYFFSEALIAKFTSYQGRGGIVDLVSGIALVAIAMAIFDNRSRVFFAMAPLVVLTFVLGSDRMNMVTFTVFMYICLKQRKSGHPMVLLIMAYFSFKSLEFVQNILLFGNGFALG